jgi:hypothetical protein
MATIKFRMKNFDGFLKHTLFIWNAILFDLGYIHELLNVLLLSSALNYPRKHVFLTKFLKLNNY